MKYEEDVFQLDDVYFLSENKDIHKLYRNIEKILTDLNIDKVYESKPSKQVPAKKKIGPTLKLIHEFDPYTRMEGEIKIKVGKPIKYETKSDKIYKITISYSAKLITEVKEIGKIRRSGYFRKIFDIFKKRIYEKAAIDKYKDYIENLMNKIINKIREEYELPGD